MLVLIGTSNGCADRIDCGPCDAEIVLPDDVVEAMNRWQSRPPRLLDSALLCVRAQVVQTCDRGRRIDGRLKIVHVFYGPDALEGQCVTAPLSRTIPLGSGPWIHYPPPRLGEIGLWLLRIYEGDLQVTLHGIHGVPFPMRDSPPSHVTLEFVETIESLSNVTDGERVSRLQELAVEESPLAAWAVHALAMEVARDARTFLEKLPEQPQITTRAQMAVDDVLLKISGDQWQHSEQRLGMFRRWASSELPEDDGFLVANHIARIAQSHHATDRWQKYLLPVLQVAIDNEAIPLRPRLVCVHAVAYFGLKRQSREDGADQPGFEYLVELVKSDRQPEIRRSAAFALKSFALDIGRRRLTVSEQLDGADDPQLREILDDVLRSNE